MSFWRVAGLESADLQLDHDEAAKGVVEKIRSGKNS